MFTVRKSGLSRAEPGDKLKRLYIIGNGFDLHHGIPSSYKHFATYLRAVDRETSQVIEDYFSRDDFWSDLEAQLAAFDTDTLLDNADAFLVGYGAEDWSDSYHHDYQFEIDRVVGAISETLRARFADWVRQLPIPSAAKAAGQHFQIDPAARYLTFNYTPTLQILYGVPERQVWHIHGAAANIAEALVLGHGWRPAKRETLSFGLDPEAADPRVVAGAQAIDQYFSATFKPTDRILRDNTAWFEALANLDEIWVMGHSLADVDLPYFAAIANRIDLGRVVWRVSYHNDPVGPRAQLESLGVPAHLASFQTLAEF